MVTEGNSNSCVLGYLGLHTAKPWSCFPADGAEGHRHLTHRQRGKMFSLAWRDLGLQTSPEHIQEGLEGPNSQGQVQVCEESEEQ